MQRDQDLLTHVALAVKNARRSFHFYKKVFGMVAVYEEDGFIQAQTPGSRNVIVFEQRPKNAGKPGGVIHYGFRLTKPDDIDAAAAAVAKVGGKILSKGEFVPGEPYLFSSDPDGYEVEIWYELPTSVDPPPTNLPALRDANPVLKCSMNEARAAKLTFILSIIAAALASGAAIVKYVKKGEISVSLVPAAIFILAFGLAVRSRIKP